MIDSYASHQEALIFSALSTTGDVLQLGCNDYSVMALNEICKFQNRNLKIVSTNKNFLQKFDFVKDRVFIKNWGDYDFSGQYGTIMFETEQHIEDKIEMLPRLFLIGKSVVVHNAARLCMKKNWNEYTENKKIIWFRNYNPHTAIIQNEI